MYIYTIAYSTDNYGSGTAVVVAGTADQAFTTLKTHGRLNATPSEYHLISATNIGVATITTVTLVQEVSTVYYNPRWGTFQGTLSDQTDLNEALEGKADIEGDTFTGDIIIDSESNDSTLTLKGHGSSKIEVFTSPDSGEIPGIKVYDEDGTLKSGFLKANGTIDTSSYIISTPKTLYLTSDYEIGGTAAERNAWLNAPDFCKQISMTTTEGTAVITNATKVSIDNEVAQYYFYYTSSFEDEESSTINFNYIKIDPEDWAWTYGTYA